MSTAPSSEWLLAEGFANAIAIWAAKLGTTPVIRERIRNVAHAVSLATSEGHVCVHLAELPLFENLNKQEIREQLLASGLVGTPAAPGSMPLILDEANRLYLHRYFSYEKRLAQRLALAHGQPPELNLRHARTVLDQLFGASADNAPVHWQKIAAALALSQQLLVLSGGPGTGKTTTIVNVLACLLGQNPECRIALTAPTGKAAARMLEAIRTNANHLPAQIQALLPDHSFTVHRLLGPTPPSGEFRYNRSNPLAIDALVVDEASMLDVALAAKLFDAVPPQARIILLGDMDQLSAVEAGAVFAELSADPSLTSDCRQRLAALTGSEGSSITPSLPRKPSPLSDSVVWFSESYRFSRDSGIGKFAALVNSGQSKETLSWLEQTTDPSITWIQDGASDLLPATQAMIVAGYAAYLEAVRSNAHDPQAVFDAFDRFRVLCAVRDGMRGVNTVNQSLIRLFGAAPQELWFVGRPIMISRNDYVMNLFNGDIGIALPDPAGNSSELLAYFPDGPGNFRTVPLARLPEHETAFAMSIHKSQGSEFDEVLLLMPANPGKINTRELLYTGVTRARKKTSVIASANTLEHAIQSPTHRNSGLIARLEEILGSKKRLP